MNPEQAVGAVGMSTMSVKPGDTSVAQAVNDLPVVAASQLIALIENACSTAILEFLEFGETTFTDKFELEICGAVGIGNELHATARCNRFENQELDFEAEVHQNARLIAKAKLHRRFVERVTFMAKTAAETKVAERSTSNLGSGKVITF